MANLAAVNSVAVLAIDSSGDREMGEENREKKERRRLGFSAVLRNE